LLADNLSTGFTDITPHLLGIPSTFPLTGCAYDITLAVAQLADGGCAVGSIFTTFSFASLTAGHAVMLAGGTPYPAVAVGMDGVLIRGKHRHLPTRSGTEPTGLRLRTPTVRAGSFLLLTVHLSLPGAFSLA
jgi:hypothetical protein